MGRTMKQIIIVIAIIFLITFQVNSEEINSGETFVIPFENTVRNCYIKGMNNLEGISLTEKDNKVILTTTLNFKPDNFSIICEVKQTLNYKESETNNRGTTYKDKDNIFSNPIFKKKDDINIRKEVDSKTRVEPEPKTIVNTEKIIPKWIWIILILLVILIIIIIYISIKIIPTIEL